MTDKITNAVVSDYMPTLAHWHRPWAKFSFGMVTNDRTGDGISGDGHGGWRDAADPATPPTLIVPTDKLPARKGSVAFLVDDGKRVTPYYVGSWNERLGFTSLEPFPTNPTGEFTGGWKDGRTVDYANWQYGPGRFYHVKLNVTHGYVANW